MVGRAHMQSWIESDHPGWIRLHQRVRAGSVWSAVVVLSILISISEPLACWLHCAWMLHASHPLIHMAAHTHVHSAHAQLPDEDASLIGHSTPGLRSNAPRCQMEAGSKSPSDTMILTHDHWGCLPVRSLVGSTPVPRRSPTSVNLLGGHLVWPPPVPPPEAMSVIEIPIC